MPFSGVPKSMFGVRGAHDGDLSLNRVGWSWSAPPLPRAWDEYVSLARQAK
jgi:hypothetical protein